MLSTAAFNAFLKTLEEPPEHAKFVFATTEIRKVPVTVLSRCQRFDLRRVEADVLMAHLANIAKREYVEVEPEALGIIAGAPPVLLRHILFSRYWRDAPSARRPRPGAGQNAGSVTIPKREYVEVEPEALGIIARASGSTST